MYKRLLSLVLSLTLIVQLFSVVAVAEDTNDNTPLGTCLDNSILGFSVGRVPAAWDGTTATEVEPQQDDSSIYQIGTAAELAWFRTHVNATAACASSAVLTADIDLGGYNWNPISTQSNAIDKYRGTFDGQGHTISGLFILGTGTNKGLFGDINGATIKNLSVEGSVSSDGSFVGGIVGSARNATIENCSFSGSVTTAVGKHVGGIVGGSLNPSTISGCVNMAVVTGGTAGGILGDSTQKNTIENCYNTGTVTGSSRSGGIVGRATKGTITNCYNIGKVEGVSAGGIHSFSSGTITNCYYLYPETDASGGTAAKSTKISSPEGLLALLASDAFKEDVDGVNDGYPLLAWQGSSDTPPDLSPSVSLDGESTIYVQAAAGATETTLSLGIKNIEAAEIESVAWELETARGSAAVEDIVDWQTADNDNTKLIVTAKGGGVVTVTAEVAVGGEIFTATRSITVIPQITTAEVVNVNAPGAVAMGQTVEVKVFVLGGDEYDYDNFPPLAYQWRNNSLSPSANISGATSRTFEIPTTTDYKEWDYLYVEITSGGAVVRDPADVRGQLRSADYGKLYPVAYDTDFVLPDEVKDNNPLVLPATRTVDGVAATITWTASSAIIDVATGAVTRPDTGTAKVTLTARCEYGTAFANKTFDITVYSQQAVDEGNNKSYLQQAVDSLGEWYGPIAPVYGKDTNIVTMLGADLAANGYDDLSVAVKSITERYDGAGIAPNGDITYFYSDPSGSRGLWFGQYRVSFTLSRGTNTLDLEDMMVNVYWDRSKVEETMRSQIMSGVTDEAVLAENSDKDNVTTNLSLPRVVNDNKWALVEWSSSDPSVIAVSNENQGTADTLFNPYVGKVIQGKEDKEVTLTAKFNFQRATANEPAIVIYKTFTFTVKSLTGTEADAIRKELMNKLNAGFDAVGLCDYVTGERLTEAEGIYTAANDILLPTTRDFGVDGKYFPITIAGSDDSTLAVPDVANAARVTVYRPMVGAAAKTVRLTVSITDLARGISASKDFTVEVTPLVQSELDDALALMDRVKTEYFDGVNDNRYADEFSITGGLHSFQEAVWNEDKSGLRWIYNFGDTTKSGIVADELEGWAEQEAWRAFRSSDMTILDHETLNHVTRPAEDTFVRINSTLTHEVYGKYAEMSGYQGFEQLYKQPVSVYVMVAGKHHPTRSQQELMRMRDEAIARISAPISVEFSLLAPKPQRMRRSMPAAPIALGDAVIDITVDRLEAGTTVFGLFRKALAQQGYTYKAVGSYVKSVTDADGNTLAERDNGPNSGWIYTVNGKMPSIYMNGYSLKEEDVVVVRFTDDYTQEDSFGTEGGGSESDNNNDNDNDNTQDEEVKNTAGITNTKPVDDIADVNPKVGIKATQEAKPDLSSDIDSSPNRLLEQQAQATDALPEALTAEEGQKELTKAEPKPFVLIIAVLLLAAIGGAVHLWIKKKEGIR